MKRKVPFCTVLRLESQVRATENLMGRKSALRNAAWNADRSLAKKRRAEAPRKYDRGDILTDRIFALNLGCPTEEIPNDEMLRRI